MDFNKVLVAGRLTRDPELKYLPNGTAVAGLGLAVNRSWVDKNSNEKKEEVLFLDVEFFGKQAESLSKHFAKGRPIFVEGRLKLDQWETPAGEKRSKMKVVGDQWRFCGGDSPKGGDQPAGGSERPASARTTPANMGVDDESMPF